MIPKFFKRKEVKREWCPMQIPNSEWILDMSREIDYNLQKGMLFRHTTKQEYELVYKKRVLKLSEFQYLTKEDEKDLVSIMKTLLNDMYNPEIEKARQEARDEISALKDNLKNREVLKGEDL